MYKLNSGVKYKPEAISSLVLKHLRRAACGNIGEGKEETAVITVPAYFSKVQELATKDAAYEAGFNCIETLAEPVAAALAQGLEEFNF